MNETADAIAPIPTGRASLLKGKEALGRGERDLARSHFERAVLDQPENILARLSLANLLQDSGHLEDAHLNYREIVIRDPKHTAALMGLARIARQMKDPETALGYLRAATKIAPDNLVVRLQIAHVMRDQVRLDEAWSAYQAILANSPPNPEAVAGLGFIAHARDDKEAALGYFKRALDLGAKTPELPALFADTLIDLGRQDEAKAIHDELLGGEPGSLRAAKLRSRVARRLRQRDDAVRHLRAATNFEPGNLTLRTELAQLLCNLNRLEEAACVYRTILAKDGRHIQSMLQLGAIARARGEDKTALAYFQTAAHLDPGNNQLSFSLVEVLVDVGQLDTAERIYRRLLVEPRHRSAAQAGLGAVARRRGDLADAAEHYRAAAALAPSVIQHQLDLARVFFDHANWNEAERTYRRILGGWPKNVDAMVGLGETAKARGDDQTALAHFRDAAEAAPFDMRLRKRMRALRNMDEYYDWKSEIDDALKIARAAGAPVTSQLDAVEILVEYGFTDAARPVLARLAPDIPRARQLVLASRQLERAGLAMPILGGAEVPTAAADDQLEALRGCIEKPVRDSDTLVIVFAGTNDRVWMTFSLLHRILQGAGVSVVYVRDLRRSWYLGGVVGLGDDVPSTVDGFRKLASRYQAKRVLTLGNCIGCRGALEYGLALRAQGVLGISPKIQIRNDLDGQQKSQIEDLRRKVPTDHKNLRARYLSAASRPKVTLIYGENYAPDADDVRYMADVPDVTGTCIPGSHTSDSVKDLLVRELLAPMLHDFVLNGVVSAEMRARISASADH